MKLSPLLCALLALAQAALAADVPKLLWQGDRLDVELKTEEALKVYLEAEKADPENAGVLHRVAREYGLSMSDVSDDASKKAYGEKALAYAKRAVAADPKNAQAQLALAISYGRLANLLDNKTKISYATLIRDHALISLQLDPNNDLTYHVLGAWNYEMANLNPILRAIAKTLYGELPPASNEDALRYLKKAVEIDPNRVGNRVELGRAYSAAGEKEKARIELQKALTLPNRDKDDDAAKKKAKDALR